MVRNSYQFQAMENMANGPSKQLASYLLYKKNQNRILRTMIIEYISRVL